MLFVYLLNFDDNDLKLYKRFNVAFKVDLTLLNAFNVDDNMQFSKLSELFF